MERKVRRGQKKKARTARQIVHTTGEQHERLSQIIGWLQLSKKANFHVGSKKAA